MKTVVSFNGDSQLPMESVPITTDVVSLNPIQVRSTRYNISLSVT
jgi:hypothetical protein